MKYVYLLSVHFDNDEPYPEDRYEYDETLGVFDQLSSASIELESIFHRDYEEDASDVTLNNDYFKEYTIKFYIPVKSSYCRRLQSGNYRLSVNRIKLNTTYDVWN